MQYKIENELIELTVDTKAAEMHSLKRKDDGDERLWNGDANYWSGRNPILFPMISSTPTKTVILKGKEYAWGNHGFARNKQFELVEYTDKSITLLLNDKNDDIYHQLYPYHFNLYVKYLINDNHVDIDYTIENKDEDLMPFGFGLHPAFSIDANDPFTYVVMQKEEMIDGKSLKKICIKDYQQQCVDTIEIPNYKSEQTALESKKHRTIISHPGFDYMAIWKKMDANFVCIEPWFHPSNEPTTKDNFLTHPNIFKLKQGETISIHYSIILDK